MPDPRIEQSARRVLARVVQSGRHPDYEVMEAAVDDRLSPEDRAAFDEHLGGCTACAGEYADLLRFARAHRDRATSAGWIGWRDRWRSGAFRRRARSVAWIVIAMIVIAALGQGLVQCVALGARPAFGVGAAMG